MERPSGRVRAALLILALAMFSMATASLTVLGIGAAITRSFGIASGAAGLLVTAFALPYAVLAPFLQWWAGGRIGANALVITGMLVAACGLGLTAAAQVWEMVLLGRGITAAGGALLGPAALAAATNLVPAAQRGRALATVYGGFTLASVVGVPLTTELDAYLGWRGAILLVASLALLTALVAYHTLPFMAPSKRIDGRALAALVIRPGLRSLLGSSVLQLTAQFVALAVMPALLMEHFGLSSTHLPVAVVAFGVSGVAGNWIAGQWIDCTSAAIPMAASFIGMALALAALVFPLGGWGGAAALAAIAFCGTLFRPAQLVLFTGLVTAEERGPALGLNTAASYIGLAFGSSLSAFIVTVFGFGAVGAAGLVSLLVAWVCVWKVAFQPA